MRIGFDAKRAFMNTSGLGNYSRTLIQSLLQNFPENNYVAYTPAIRQNLGNELIESGRLNIVLPPQLMRTFLSSLWRSSMISEDIRAQNLDVYHGLSNELPKRMPVSTKKIVTIHDLIFLRHPEWYPLVDRNIYYKKMRYACRQADAVVAVSGHTKKDIMYYFNTAEEKIKVIYQSCNERFYHRTAESGLREFQRKNKLPEKYILYVGTVEERKNLLTLVKALLTVKDISLVVVGRKKAYFEKVDAFIRSHQLESRVIFPGDITADGLPLLYQGAAAFVYPSMYEGFGIPVIEALCSGTPVIASCTSSLPEAGGPAALYFNPHDEGALSEKLLQVLNDPLLREKMVREGLEYVKRFNPAVTSTQMMDLYKGNMK